MLHLWFTPRIKINETQLDWILDFMANLCGYQGKLEFRQDAINPCELAGGSLNVQEVLEAHRLHYLPLVAPPKRTEHDLWYSVQESANDRALQSRLKVENCVRVTEVLAHGAITPQM